MILGHVGTPIWCVSPGWCSCDCCCCCCYLCSFSDVMTILTLRKLKCVRIRDFSIRPKNDIHSKWKYFRIKFIWFLPPFLEWKHIETKWVSGEQIDFYPKFKSSKCNINRVGKALVRNWSSAELHVGLNLHFVQQATPLNIVYLWLLFANELPYNRPKKKI